MMAWLFACAAAAAIASAPGSAPDSGRARSAFSRGMTAHNRGDLAAARAAFAEAARFAPDWPLAVLHLGMTEQALDPTSGPARVCLEKAVSLAPRNPRAHAQLGTLYQSLGRLDDAARELRTALDLRPGMTDVAFALASVLAARGDRDEAVAAFEALVAREPGHTGALAALAELHEAAGELEAAETALLAITRAQPKVAYHHYRLAQFYERHQAPAKAKQAYARAEALDPRAKRKMRELR